MSIGFQETKDHITNEALQTEVDRLTRIVARYERQREQADAADLEKKLDSIRAAEAAEAARVEADRRKLAQVGLTRPENLTQWGMFSPGLKARMIAAYGADLPAHIRMKERAQMSWNDFDRFMAQNSEAQS